MAAAILKIGRRQKPIYGGFRKMPAPRGLLNPALAIMPYPTVTRHRQAHIILESASLGKRGGSHSKQWCSTDARTMA
jgi:hypothetical protein